MSLGHLRTLLACEGQKLSQSEEQRACKVRTTYIWSEALFAALQCAAVTRLDWLRNAAGLRQVEYWTGKLEPRPTVDWCAAVEIYFRP
jgi:hypothetical protein